jgi:hypothetical protein
MKYLALMMALTLATPAAAQTQAQMNAQAGNEWKAADAAMTAQWKRTYAYMKGREPRTALAAAASALRRRRWKASEPGSPFATSNARSRAANLPEGHSRASRARNA